MVKLLKVYILISIAIVSCKVDDTPEARVITLNKKNDTLKFADVFEYKDLIQLETSKNCLISEVSQLEFFDDRIVVLDKISNSVFLFNKNGKFINRIGNVGYGPGEYIRPRHMFVSKKNKNIKVYDPATRFLLIYDKDGVFIKTLRLGRVLRSIGEFADCYWGFVSNNQVDDLDKSVTKFITFNKDGEYIDSFEGERIIDECDVSNAYITNELNDGVSYVEANSSKVFFFDGKSVKTHFTIDAPGLVPPSDFYEKLQKGLLKPKLLSKVLGTYFTSYYNYLENEKWVFGFTFGKTTWFLNNKVTSNTLCLRGSDYQINDKTIYLPMKLIGDNVFTVVEPNVYKQNGAKHGYISKKDPIRKVLDKLKYSDNPVILRHEIRNF